MLKVFTSTPQGLTSVDLSAQTPIPGDVLWIDLLEPTPEEEKAVEALLLVDVPTREEMKEIETSNRLYEDNDALYMTATVAAKLDTARPEIAAVTFILTKGRLITNRYVDTKPFQQFIAYAEKHPNACQSSLAILAGLIEALIERIADILERAGNDLDAVSSTIFVINGSGRTDSSGLRGLIERIGFNGELNSKARESLVSVGRLVMFVQQTGELQMTQEQRGRFRSISRDITALSDHASFLGSKMSFLLDATLGFINIEQTNIVKLFSVVAVAFLPPTLIASIYGMNFDFMPELKWHYGYLVAIGLMILSAVLPMWYFRRRGWL